MKLIKTLKGHDGCINALTSIHFNNTDYLISGSSDSTVKIWDQNSAQSVYQLPTGHTDSIQAIAYQNRLNLLAIGSKDKSFSLWKTKEYEGKNIKTINAHTDVIEALVILPNTNIVSASADNTIKIWQSESPFECITTLYGHTAIVGMNDNSLELTESQSQLADRFVKNNQH